MFFNPATSRGIREGEGLAVLSRGILTRVGDGGFYFYTTLIRIKEYFITLIQVNEET